MVGARATARANTPWPRPIDSATSEPVARIRDRVDVCPVREIHHVPLDVESRPALRLGTTIG